MGRRSDWVPKEAHDRYRSSKPSSASLNKSARAVA